MEFTLHFRCIDILRYNVASKPKAEDAGLVGLDFIRRQLKNPRLPAEELLPKIPQKTINVRNICITEKLARKTGYFENKNCVTVIVPENGLTPYLYPKALESLQIVWDMADSEIIDDWVAAGCPIEWDPEKTEKTTEELLQAHLEMKITQKNGKNIGALFISSDGTTTAVYVGCDGHIKWSNFETEQEAREHVQNMEAI